MAELIGSPPPQFSPDGRFISYNVANPRAYSVAPAEGRYPLDINASQLFIYDAKTQSSTAAASPSLTSWGGAWSPGSSKLAYFRRDGTSSSLWLFDPRSRVSTRLGAINPKVPFGFRLPSWTPDGAKLLVVTSQQASPVPPEAGRERSYNSASVAPKEPVDNGANPRRADYQGDLDAIDVRSGASKRLVTGAAIVTLAVDPQGHYLAYTTIEGHRRAGSQQLYYQLWLMPLAGGSPLRLAEVPHQDIPVIRWSREGRHMAILSIGPETPDGLIMASTDGTLTKFVIPQGCGPELEREGVRWSRVGETLALTTPHCLLEYSAKQAEPVARFTPGKAERLSGVTEFVESESGLSLCSLLQSDRSTYSLACWSGRDAEPQRTQLPVSGQILASCPQMSFGQCFLVMREGWDTAPDLWQITQGKAERVSVLNPLLDGKPFAVQELLHWQTRTGKANSGTLLLPTGSSAPLPPVIVHLYGGESFSQEAKRFGFSADLIGNPQAYAAAGLAFFAPDLPLNSHEPMAEIAERVEEAVNALVATGRIDPKRIGLIGQSYGSYSVLSVLTRSHRYKAAVISAVVADLGSLYGHLAKNGSAPLTRWSEGGQGHMGAMPWANWPRYDRNSPYRQLDKIETPLLVMQGGADISPPYQADLVFVGLSRLNKTVSLNIFEGEPHAPPQWSGKNRLRYFHQTLDWFNRYLH